MKAFVWKRLNCVTDNWHPEGGLLIVAADLEAANELFKNENGRMELPPPDFVFEAPGHTDSFIVVFADSGCC
jgi:hypothetical protein